MKAEYLDELRGYYRDKRILNEIVADIIEQLKRGIDDYRRIVILRLPYNQDAVMMALDKIELLWGEISVRDDGIAKVSVDISEVYR